MGILIEAEANIYLKGPPSITSTKKQFGIPGETVQIECVAFSIPKPRHILWSYNGREINSSHDEDYTVTEEITSFGMKSSLAIRDSDSKHFGSYNCSVTNDYGHDNVVIVLSGLRKFTLAQLTTLLNIYLFVLLRNLCRSHNFGDFRHIFFTSTNRFALRLSQYCSVIFSDDSQVTFVFIVLAIILFIVMVAMISLICIKSGKKKLPPADVIPEVCVYAFY